MKPRVLDWRGISPEEQEKLLVRPASLKNQELQTAVSEIVAAVRRKGDQAARELTARFDRVSLTELKVSADEFATARRSVGQGFEGDIGEAIRRVSLFHRAQLPKSIDLETAPGARCERRFLPIERVGLYVPGGSAPLPSTVVMLGVPALIAGCGSRTLLTPPRPDGSIDPHILLAAELLGINQVFKLGGAQAVAAMAFGTESIPKVDKIFGPGNSWVTEAKLQVAQDPNGAMCDLPAGPSEVLVIADETADAAFVASDLLAQAEHGEDSQVLLISNSAALIQGVLGQVVLQLETLPRRAIAAASLSKSLFIQVGSLEQAVEISNRYAPEHLIVQTREPRRLSDGIRNAGSVFLGRWTPETVGDYASGTNHVLPTYGFARACGGLTTESFMKSITFQELTEPGLRALGPVVARLARAEQLEGHAAAVDVRLKARAP